MISRKDIQEKINTIVKNNPKGDLSYIKDQLGGWIDTFDLSTSEKILDVDINHEFMKEHILDDLSSYENINKTLLEEPVKEVLNGKLV